MRRGQKGRSVGLEQREQEKHAGGRAGLFAEAGALCLLGQVKSLNLIPCRPMVVHQRMLNWILCMCVGAQQSVICIFKDNFNCKSGPT